MKPSAGPTALIDPARLPKRLGERITAAIHLANLDSSNVPSDLRIAVFALRKSLQLKSSDEFGCSPALLVAFGAYLLGATWLQISLAIILTLTFYGGVRSVLRRRQHARTRTLTPEQFRLATEVAGFGATERAAIEAALAPRADEVVRAEVSRLIEEDARLVAALDDLGDAELDPIEADHLRIRLALARETDPATRAALEASLALCDRRLASAKSAFAVADRIRAHRELILQTLRATSASLVQNDVETSDLTFVRERVQDLTDNVAAIEAAVQEIKGSESLG